METYVVKRPATLTVHPGSRVIVTDGQYRAAKDYLAKSKDESGRTKAAAEVKPEETDKAAL